LKASGLERAPADLIADGRVPAAGIAGRVVARGLADELADRHYLIVDGVDGRIHYVGIGQGRSIGALPEGAIVLVTPAESALRPADKRIAEIAAANNGLYSREAHRDSDPGAASEFIGAHIRRLEALRHAALPVERLQDGSWQIPETYLEDVRTHEQRRTRAVPARVVLLSPLAIERLPQWDGPTWLDRQIAASDPQPTRDAGFGSEVRVALEQRRQWLLGEQLALEEAGEVRLKPDTLRVLERREIGAAARQFGSSLGKPFAAAGEGEPVAGRLIRRVDLASGCFALVEDAHEFTLVPWRPILERHLGREISGLVRPGGGISWHFGKERGLER
jgi:hypothetical protein